MDEMLMTLQKIGFSADQCERLRTIYDGDVDGLTLYVLYCVALYDDRHEYLA